MSDIVPVMLSRYIYDVLQTFFYGANNKGNSASAKVLKKFYSPYANTFPELSFEQFMLTPQTYDNLKALLKDVENIYPRFIYNENIFTQFSEQNDYNRLKIKYNNLKNDYYNLGKKFMNYEDVIKENEMLNAKLEQIRSIL